MREFPAKTLTVELGFEAESRPIQAIAFDFDGVLVDSVDVKGEAFAAMYSVEGEEVAARVLRHHQKNGGVDRYSKFALYEGDFCGRRVDPERIARLADQFSELVVKQIVDAREIPGASEILRALWSLPKFIVSATPKTELRRIVAEREMNEHFVEVLGGPEGKVDLLKWIVQTTGAPAQQVLMLGDSSTDLEAARAVGTQFVGFQGAFEFPPGVRTVVDHRELLHLIKFD